MIAPATRQQRKARKIRWQLRFLEMLPAICRYAQRSFSNVPAEARAELVQETVANCLVAFRRLVERQQADCAFPSALARFAVAQVRFGRRVAGSLNVHEVLSGYAQRQQSFHVQRLDQFDPAQGQWRAALVEDPRTPVAEQAAFRIDFPAWLAQLAPRQRQIAVFLAEGNTTGEAARRFQLSAGRISQMRRALFGNWLRYHATDENYDVF